MMKYRLPLFALSLCLVCALMSCARKGGAIKRTAIPSPLLSAQADSSRSSGFCLLGARIEQEGGSYVLLEFSSELDPEQELDGLVCIAEAEPLIMEKDGAKLRVHFPPVDSATLSLSISQLLRSASGERLNSDIEQTLKQELLPPSIEIPLSGSILPDGGNLSLPFKAVNLSAVDVSVIKIYSDNMLVFLQDNDIDGEYRLDRVGQTIFRETVRLDTDPKINLRKWQSFSVDLKGLFRKEKNAVYNISLSFRDEYSLAGRPRRWNRAVSYNLAASNIGLMAKSADKRNYLCVVNDIMTAEPLSGVRIVAYNYQMRELGSCYTDEQGFASLRLSSEPFVLMASDALSTSFLKIRNAYELSMSKFDVSGQTEPSSLKGFVYADRAVWRPGDEIYLNLILEDKLKTLPANHPVTMKLLSPTDQVFDTQTLTKSTGGIYSFKTKTLYNSPTGLWAASFTVGNRTFTHPVRIETIRPNRLKIKLSSPAVLKAGEPAKLGLEAHWLSGPVARGLNASLELALTESKHPFDGYKGYTFSNPLKESSDSEHKLISSPLDSLGRMSKVLVMPELSESSGMMRGNLIARVEERGGEESISTRSVSYSPYSSYVGVMLGDGVFETDSDLYFHVVALDPSGKELKGRKLEYKILRINSYRWNESSALEKTRYMQSKSAEQISSGSITSGAESSCISLRIDKHSWGSYLVYVKDSESGHACGGEIYVDWPDWRGRKSDSDAKQALMLDFSLDKASYTVGEQACVYLPKARGARVLLTVENSRGLLSKRWVELSSESETKALIDVGKDMAPNFYLSATMLAPHKESVDLPLRRYGVRGARVEDVSTLLAPVIDAPEEVLPQEEFEIKVREEKGRKMSYTLAIVDEGLLDITRFKTPDPWSAMNAKEALGVKTWDMYSDVIRAQTGFFTPLLSIGGDEALRSEVGKEKRFNPVVEFLGPFTLEAGKSMTHKITLPMYVGSLRVMLVAAQDGCYGSSDADISVRAPLMILPSLPRVLNCGDKAVLGVNVLASQACTAKVTAYVEGEARLLGQRSKSLEFSGPGDGMLEFELEGDKKLSGKAKIVLRAEGAGHRVSESVSIEVQNAHKIQYSKQESSLAPGSRAELSWPECLEASLEVSSLPSINFAESFGYLGSYSHYCTEQLSSKAMFVLYARRFLSEKQAKEASEMLPGLLKAISLRQLPSGGFAYWSEDKSSQHWASSMAGEVFCEARRQGFQVEESVIERWVKFQQSQTGKYKHTTREAADLVQAYRLYTLVLAGKNPAAGMNKLRESKSLSRAAVLRLSAAYALAGREDVAASLLEKAQSTAVVEGSYESFYSPLRDLAMEIEARAIAGDSAGALRLAQGLPRGSSELSTQELAFVSAALCRLASASAPCGAEFELSLGGKKAVRVRGVNGTKSVGLGCTGGKVSVVNTGQSELALALLSSRMPLADERPLPYSKGISARVVYTDLSGRPLDVSRLKQGTDFRANITVDDCLKSSEYMALTYYLPAGWEAWNEALVGGRDARMRRDIRDERVSWYFSVAPGGKRSFSLRLRAAFCGEYVMPALVCEDMYDRDCVCVGEWKEVCVEK